MPRRSESAKRTGVTRHHGMDWLRIGAFALLILYHIGMVFSPWNFHINYPRPIGWVVLPMLAINPWRLTLLFVVSGYASRTLLAKSPGWGGFAKNRSWRLLVPLAFGIAVIVPPQPWAELVVKYGYPAGYGHFWLHDYFLFRAIGPIALPAWNHLWFVAYVWVYTMLLVAVAAAIGRFDWQGRFDRTFGGAAVIWVPLAWLVAIHGWWFVMAAESHALLGDWVAHLMYLPAFLFGLGLARSEPAMRAITGRWRWGLALAVLGYAAVIAIELGWLRGTLPRAQIDRVYGAAHAIQQWGAIIALIGVAERWWNRDARWRPMLTEAVFPFYIIHQTIIVVVMYRLLRFALPAWADFLILVAATVAGCWAFYLIGRRVPLLRPLIGLRLR